MVSRQAVKNGLSSYLEAEVIPHLPTAGKWGVGALIVLTQDKMDEIIDTLSHNEMVKALDVVNEEGNIDIDRISEALTKSAAKYGKMQISIPILGSITFDAHDVDILKQHIYNRQY